MSFSRDKRPKVLGRKIAILCEGLKTEVGYFNAIRQSMRLPTVRIRVVHPDATDPLSIVNSAITLREEIKGENGWEKEDTVWVVFDGDEHIQHNRKNWDQAIQKAKGNGIKLAITNPSFELWYLLHYQDQNANLSRKAAIAALKKYIQKYDKASCFFPKPLQELTDNAIQRGTALSKRNADNGVDVFTNPCACAHKLVQALLNINNPL